MAARKRPSRIVGSSRIPLEPLKTLRHAYRSGTLVPFVGAGASVPYGIPTWKDLVVDVLFSQPGLRDPLRALPTPYRRGIAAWLADYVNYDLSILARVAKAELVGRTEASRDEAERAFIKMLRARLYPRKPPKVSEPNTLTALADLIAEGVESRAIPAVVTFNYDDLLEQELSRRRVAYEPVWSSARRKAKGVPIIHVHGFLPRRGGIPREPIVFTEDEYHRLAESVFHWAFDEVVHHLRYHNAVFLGLSITDPNLRRLLDAAHVPGEAPAHVQVQQRRTMPVEQIRRAAIDIGCLARTLERPDAPPPARERPRLVRALRQGLSLAEQLDRELLHSMGIASLWLESFDDIAPLLQAISSR